MRKDSFSQEELRKLDLNDRQVRAVMYVKEKGRITNKEYRMMFDITDRMALIDLSDICAKNIFERIGKTGRNIEYVLSRNKPEKPEINPKLIRIIDEEREAVMTDIKIKHINQPGDYYFCSLCAAWHRCTNDPSSNGNQHLSHLEENETNSPASKYFFCSLCSKWHTDARKDHLRYRLHIKRDLNMITAPIVQQSRAHSTSNSHHFPTAVLGSFDGAAGLWKNETELLNSIPSITARGSCESVLALVKSLDKDLHIQLFNRKNGFSFIVKGLKIAEIKLGSGGFILRLIQNILNQGYTSVHQDKKDFVYPGSGNHPISDADLRTHFIREANNLISLRKNNTIGYREKWLHSLLIDKMQDGSLPGLDLEFLYYETPVGKVKRNKQFGRCHFRSNFPHFLRVKNPQLTILSKNLRIGDND